MLNSPAGDLANASLSTGREKCALVTIISRLSVGSCPKGALYGCHARATSGWTTCHCLFGKEHMSLLPPSGFLLRMEPGEFC